MKSMRNNEPRALTIGEVARASGLSVSALRFYGRQGVLVPATVDAATGYRWYAHDQLAEAKLLARLRRIGLPLREVSTILARGDPDLTNNVLADHISSLEEGLAVSRSEVLQLSQQLAAGIVPAPELSGDAVANSFTATLQAADLHAGLRVVRHAIGSDPDLPAIHGVFCVAVSRGIRLSATDRRRAAFAEIPAEGEGRVRALLPTADADRLLTMALDAENLTLTAQAGGLSVRDEEGSVVFKAPFQEAAFPDLSHAIPAGRGGYGLIEADELLAQLDRHPQAEVWALNRSADLLHPVPAQSADARWGTVLVGRGYLLDALIGLSGDVGGQLRFDFDGPADALAIRRSEDLGTFAVLLPVVPEGTA